MRRCASRLLLGSRRRLLQDTAAISELEQLWAVNFAGRTPFTNSLSLTSSSETPATQIFRVLDPSGKELGPIPEGIDREVVRQMLRCMYRVYILDTLMYQAQRHGRISFYLTGFLEEGIQIGAAAALQARDEIFAQYREVGVLLWRGYPLDGVMAQCTGNVEDPGKGRQMPIHYGSPAHNFQTVSSPLCTQVPHAAGYGYALRLENEALGEGAGDAAKRVAVAFFGEGAASEGDFHAGLNAAAVRGSHTLFLCRNNGFAISTPSNEQYRGDGIHARGWAYGIPSVRVDGSDALAVYAAVQAARRQILATGKPALVEAMAFRGGPHSTSDDDTQYRQAASVTRWRKLMSPIARLGAWAQARGWWSFEEAAPLKETLRQEVIAALTRHERLPKLAPKYLADDVYATVPPSLAKQRDEVLAAIAEPDHGH